ncbi:MAG: glycosyltransferase family 39 protein, partial [Acidobacteriaceae bacterium]|nr:glycosyltransferase family 39 protein [Acidobacteriaceae bacterium]
IDLLLLLAVAYSLGRRSFGEHEGFYSALVLGTSVGPYLFTRFLIPEVLVALWLGLTFLLFLRSLGEETPSRFTCWGIAAMCALNVLTKGLIGLVFPVAVIVLYLLLTRNLRHLLRLRLFSSTCVFLAVASPWHILAAIRNPAQGHVRGFLWFYFVNEHFLRYLNKRVPRDYDTVPLVVYWVLVLVWMVPWFVFLPQAVKKVTLHRQQDALVKRQPANSNLLFLLWALVILVFFSFSTRQEYYTIPALPGLALLIGGWLQKERDIAPDRRSGRTSSLILFIVGILAFIAGVVFLFLSKVPPPGTELAELLRKNPQDYALSFGHFFDLTPQAIGAFHGPLLVFSFALLVGTGLNWILRQRNKPASGNFVLATMMIVVLGCVHTAFITFSPILSSKRLADALAKHYRPGDLVVVDGLYENASTLNFYTGIPLRSLHEPAGNLWFGSQFPDAPPIFEDESTFRSQWDSEKHVFLWTDQDQPKELSAEKSYLVAHSGGKSILTNHPLKTD